VKLKNDSVEEPQNNNKLTAIWRTVSIETEEANDKSKIQQKFHVFFHKAFIRNSISRKRLFSL
jgi:hypothetical protein